MRPAAAAVWIVLAAGLPARAGGEIYAEIETSYGAELAGPVRWDVHDNFWSDQLDVSKPEPLEQEQRGFRLSLFGLKLGGDSPVQRNSLSIPFGHIRSIERLGDEQALVLLKSGEEMEVHVSSKRLHLTIDDENRGRVELRWQLIDEIRFRSGPGKGLDGERLYATVDTRAGAFEGFLVWDRDESLAQDVLDGRDEARVDREIAFGTIRGIERVDATKSRVTLKDGETIVLRGTNDVNDENRGLLLLVRDLGRIAIDWSDVTRVVLSDPPASPAYRSFDGGRPLAGTVRTRDGKRYHGRITWDRDEARTFEALDGWSEGIDYAVRLSNIAKVRRLDEQSSEVVLRDGRTLVLSDTRDVGDGNRGLVIQAEGAAPVELGWSVVDHVEFE